MITNEMNDQNRKEFEAVMFDKLVNIDPFNVNRHHEQLFRRAKGGDDYLYLDTRSAWITWQAARASAEPNRSDVWFSQPQLKTLALALSCEGIGYDQTMEGRIAELVEELCESVIESVRARTSREPKVVVVPDGWALVPVEATDNMIKAVYPLHYFTQLGTELKQHYAAMLAAAPKVPEGRMDEDAPHQARTLALLAAQVPVVGGHVVDTGSYIVDWDEDSKHMLSIGIRPDGRIWFARYDEGVKVNGQYDCDGETLPPAIIAQLRERFGTGDAPAPAKECLTAGDGALVEWAVGRWFAEVSQRPLVNVHRRTLDGTWRQVIRHAGGDDIVRCGPRHDELLAQAKESGNDR